MASELVFELETPSKKGSAVSISHMSTGASQTNDIPACRSEEWLMKGNEGVLQRLGAQ